MQFVHPSVHLAIAAKPAAKTELRGTVVNTYPLHNKFRSFLVVGDPLCATTHTDLWLRARLASS